MVVFVGEDHQPQHVASLRPHDLVLLISFSGFDTPEDVGRLRNHNVYVRTADRPALAEGEYYHHQMLGLKVIEENGNALGILTDILETGADDVYIVQPAGVVLAPPVDGDWRRVVARHGDGHWPRTVQSLMQRETPWAEGPGETFCQVAHFGWADEVDGMGVTMRVISAQTDPVLQEAA